MIKRKQSREQLSEASAQEEEQEATLQRAAVSLECSSLKPFQSQSPCYPAGPGPVQVQALVLVQPLVQVQLVSLVRLVGEHPGLPAQSALVLMASNSSRLNDLVIHVVDRLNSRICAVLQLHLDSSLLKVLQQSLRQTSERGGGG